jgi:predicted nucleotidyltransferase
MAASVCSRLATMAREYRIDDVYVFGSRAAEIARLVAGAEPVAEHPESDVDIGIQPERGYRPSARDRVRLTLELETLLGVPRVDLVILPEANAFLAAEIVRGELLYARDLDQEAETQLYYLRRAGDLAPFFRDQWRQTVGGEL